MRILNRQLKFPVHSGTVGIAMYLLLVIFAFPLAMAEESGEIKARKVIQAAIEAMGGDAYLSVNATHSYGRYFQFSKGRKSFAQYNDWTVLKPVKWRFQLGKGKNQFVSIYNLEEGKGWTLEGKDIVEEIPEDDIEKFRRSAKEDLDIILRFRLDEEGMNFFYYGPNDIAGQGKHEAVEFLDMMNKSIVVFFDRQSHLPAKLEKHFTDSVGVRRKEEMEMSNWHEIQGIMTPLRFDTFVDEEVSVQRFLEGITFNPEIPPEHFLKPVIVEK